MYFYTASLLFDYTPIQMLVWVLLLKYPTTVTNELYSPDIYLGHRFIIQWKGKVNRKCAYLKLNGSAANEEMNQNVPVFTVNL